MSFDTRFKQYYESGMSFHDLEIKMYPSNAYPRYWNYASNGGPPGGRMSFTAALKRRGLQIFGYGSTKKVYGEPK
jgi:hypothetical protein